MGLELGLGLREIGEIRFEIGVGESLAQLAYRVQLRVHGVEHVLGPRMTSRSAMCRSLIPE